MCWYCGKPVEDSEPIGRSLRCTVCGKDLRVCKNCRFYTGSSRGDCSEPRAEIPFDKERGNFCDWFSLDPELRKESEGQKTAGTAETNAKAAFDALFDS